MQASQNSPLPRSGVSTGVAGTSTSSTVTSSTDISRTDQSSAPAPVVHARQPGWHANNLGLDWNMRADHHKYLLKTGLPEVHAAILNEDWDYASEVLCAEDLSLRWLPPVGQRPPAAGTQAAHSSRWSDKLASSDEATRQRAIIEMAIDLVGATSMPDAGCLYGSNLLTLCLLKPVPAAFMQKIITLAATEAPHTLQLPDGSGRTPLWVAVDNGDAAQVALLLAAGADPFVSCDLPKPQVGQSPFAAAIAKGPDEIVALMLEAALRKEPTTEGCYSYEVDPFMLQHWVARSSASSVLWMAGQIKALQDPLMCFNDASGTSVIYRLICNDASPRKLLESFAHLDILVMASTDQSTNILDAAALHAPVDAYLGLLQKAWQQLGYFGASDQLRGLCDLSLMTFLLQRKPAEIARLLRKAEGVQAKLVSIAPGIIHAALSCAFEEFTATVKAFWPFLSDTQKRFAFAETARHTDGRMDYVFGMLDCSLDFASIQRMREIAAECKNTAAYEFAAERSLDLGSMLKNLHDDGDGQWAAGSQYAYQALQAGSLPWFQRIIDAGLKLAKFVNSYASHALPLLADLDPAALATRLQGLQVVIDEAMIRRAKTEAGKAALRALKTPATAHS